MGITINEFEAENVKRIRAVKLHPSPTGLTIIGGNNGQGKTSVLDSIAWALGGEKFRPTDAKNKDSVIPPYLHVTLSNGLVVERNGKNSSLKVTDPSGEKAGQKLLDSFIGTLALDLPKFMNASNTEKAKILLNILGVGDQLEKLNNQERKIYDERTAIGRIADQKEKYAKEQPYYSDVPEAPISSADLIKQQQEILARNGENQRKRDRVKEITFEKHRIFDEAQRLEEQIAELTARLEERRKAYEKTAEDEAIAMKDAAELEDESTTELEESIANVEETNRKVRANLDKEKAEDDARQYRRQYDQLTDQIENIRNEKKSLLDHADLPLEGLCVENGNLIYNGEQWDCMSSSDQLKVATAIVKKLNPECGFVLIDKLEQMDMQTLKEFGDWLELEGLQVIATRVSTGEECSIIIEDGTVAESPVKEEKPKFVQKAWAPGEF